MCHFRPGAVSPVCGALASPGQEAAGVLETNSWCCVPVNLRLPARFQKIIAASTEMPPFFVGAAGTG
jgi:hypothetical protein